MKAHNIRKTAKVWNQAVRYFFHSLYLVICLTMLCWVFFSISEISAASLLALSTHLFTKPSVIRSHVFPNLFDQLFQASIILLSISFTLCFYYVNALRTGDADLRFYITTVQDGWRKYAFLTRACFPCTIHLIMQNIEPVSEWFCWRMFIETWPHSELTFRHRASSI